MQDENGVEVEQQVSGRSANVEQLEDVKGGRNEDDRASDIIVTIPNAHRDPVTLFRSRFSSRSRSRSRSRSALALS